MGYPQNRMRRLRSSQAVRRLVSETSLCADNFIYPLFVKSGKGIKEPIKSLTDSYYFSPDSIAAEVEQIYSLGIPAVLLFGHPSQKDDIASQSWSEDGTVQQAIKQIKQRVPQIAIITDVCLCAYTKNGHCGIIKDGKIDNDATCQSLAKVALSHAQAGADIVAPSDMMDGRVKFIRECLEENGFPDVGIMSYAAKYASSFYGPFRDAADSSPAFGDRKSYQMDTANVRQALREIELDIEEGADIVMIKPALSFLDVICKAKEKFSCPVAAYNVSGEYMMIIKAAENGVLDKNAAMMEVLYSIKRAGADIIISYFAKEAAKLLSK